MKVLCVGYYDKFSRLFLGIGKELKKKHPDLEFKIHSLFFSGFFYSLLRGAPSSLISFRAWYKVLSNKKKHEKILGANSRHKNLELEKLIDYQLCFDKDSSRKDLLLQAVSYIDLIDRELSGFRPDFMLLVGDSRMAIQVAKLLAQQRNIKTYFIEQGPFNSTFFDPKGVNANASIREFEINGAETTDVHKKAVGDFVKREKPPKYNRSPIYRGVDYLIKTLFEKTILFPPDLRFQPSLIKKHSLCKDKDFRNKTFNLGEPAQNIFLLICQVPSDVNLTHYSPRYKDHFSMLKDVHENLPQESLLVVREHPLYRGRYEKGFYEYIKNHQVYVDCHKSLDPVFGKADVVVVNNSTVGLEAIFRNKTLVVLGEAYYDHPKLCLKPEKKSDLKSLLEKALDHEPSKKDATHFLHGFFQNHLIPGHYMDKGLPVAKPMAEKMDSFYRSKEKTPS